MKKLLVIDDDAKIHESFSVALDRHFELINASCREEAITFFDEKKPDVVFLDIEFYDKVEGFDILRELRKKDGSVSVYLMSGNCAHKDNLLVKQANGFFVKPLSVIDIRSELRKRGLME